MKKLIISMSFMVFLLSCFTVQAQLKGNLEDDPTQDDIGIGLTGTPEARLHIKKTTATLPALRLEGLVTSGPSSPPSNLTENGFNTNASSIFSYDLDPSSTLRFNYTRTTSGGGSTQTTDGTMFTMSSLGAVSYGSFTAQSFIRSNSYIMANSFIQSSSFIRSNTNVIALQKMGIGTSAPSEKLTINNGFGKANGFIVWGSNATQSSWDAPWYGISVSGANAVDIGQGANGRAVLLQGFYGLGMKTERGSMTMDRRGRVTIGMDDIDIESIALTSFTDHNLYVAKGIRTEKVKVDNKDNWPDYVFAPEYDLKPLKEVEAFITENSHLPEVPSEKEVNENGIDVATMDAVLLKKIEELTLYTIEQQKQIEALRVELQQLKNKD